MCKGSLKSTRTQYGGNTCDGYMKRVNIYLQFEVQFCHMTVMDFLISTKLDRLRTEKLFFAVYTIISHTY